MIYIDKVKISEELLLDVSYIDAFNAKFPYIRFASEKGVEAIYVAGIWDGDANSKLLGAELIPTLAEGELASFDSATYTKLIEVENKNAFNKSLKTPKNH